MSLITPRSDILTEVGIHLLQSKVQVMWSSHNRASIPSTNANKPTSIGSTKEQHKVVRSLVLME